MSDDTDARPPDGEGHVADGPERGAREGVDHLQAAASELIAAARSFLDVVEELSLIHI